MRKVCEFFVFIGILCSIIFLLIVHFYETKEEETEESKKTSHYGEAYANMTHSSLPILSPPTPALPIFNSAIDSKPVIPARVHKIKPPVIPRKKTRKTKKRKRIKYPVIIDGAVFLSKNKPLGLYESERHLIRYFCDTCLYVDSSVWQKNFGWPSRSQIKWLTWNIFEGYALWICDSLKIRDCYSNILDIKIHESSGSPHAVNRQSGAVGSNQVVYTTAYNFSKSSKCNIPIGELDRSDPWQNIKIASLFFKNNLSYFKKKGYKNYRDWAILAHYAGPGAAEDTAAYHAARRFYPDSISDIEVLRLSQDTSVFERSQADVYCAPFVQKVIAIRRLKPKKPKEWAIKLWSSHSWDKIETIRLLSQKRRKNRKNS